ncbi:hypothetical protein D6851_15495 [Altericroceibacterium spongiae]|uniref:Inner membrane protein n=2 Tax=Altericroceibacterium spongiae TaxID=2320269 RepID=A0A420EC61_9SPHN|nr:hypothetical protein D6851_15495 [Altericroceibacterium spongiae]
MAPILGLAVAAFVAGAALTSFLGWRYGADLLMREPSPVQTVAPAPAPSAEPSPAETGRTANALFPPISDPDGEDANTRETVERVAEQQGGIDQRVAAMEQRLTRLDLQAQAAAGNAARAEGLLVAFATRRAIERGAPLGYLEDQLRLRFGDAHPNAVRAVIEASRRPITLDQLVARLEGLAPELIVSPNKGNSLARLRDELGDLFVIRPEDSPSPAPRRRLDRARLFLESDRVESAIAEVRNLPNAAQASGWIAAAERYARAREALDRLEMTAILEPRQLNDAAGNSVEQPSPAGASPASTGTD